MTECEKALAYFHYQSIYDVMREFGFSDVDAERFIVEIYEDETAPTQQ